MTEPRAHISAKVRVDVAINQATGLGIWCPLCRQMLYAEQQRILEHMTPHEFTKDSGAANLAWVHKACADKKTNGKPHVKVDGDISKIAKSKRLSIARLAKDEVEQRVGNDPGYRLKKRMDGTVVRVRTK